MQSADEKKLYDMEKDFLEIYNKCKEYTMTSIERMYALYKGMEYICKRKIPGDLVECGVWKGGSSMLMLYTELKFGGGNRNIYLYDTFEGMTEPTDHDAQARTGIKAGKILSDVGANNKTKNEIWAYSPLEDVKKNIALTGYPSEKIHLIKGPVEKTIPDHLPSEVALLRLDTDWYESTIHELNHLYPLLQSKGVMIIDDYGHWEGAKKAVDEYFEKIQTPVLLNRIDYTGRMMLKC